MKKKFYIYKFLNLISIWHFKIKYNIFFKKNILDIPIEKIIIWDIHWINSYQYYKLTNNSNRLESKIIDSFYVKYFEKLKQQGWKISEYDIKKSDYFKEALFCIENLWSYFNCKNEKELLNLFKSFNINKYISDENFPILEKVKDSEFYTVKDWHHRISLLYIKWINKITSYVCWEWYSWIQKVITWVRMTKEKELYQPINFLTTKYYPLIRECEDRFKLINDFLNKENINKQQTLIDFACSYGYFVNSFNKIWINSTWVEIDKNAINIWKLSYWDLNIINSSIQDFLNKNNTSYDIVLLFSIIHHFWLNKDFWKWWIKLNNLIKEIDKITNKFLFLDSWQNHENWFKNKLKKWDDKFIINLIMSNSNFKWYVKLWIDNDNKWKFIWNYWRSLFVFYK